MPGLTDSVNDSFSPLEILIIVKHLRPDAIESYLTSLAGEVRVKNYSLLPRTNFETHSNLNWHRRPTILYYGSTSRNPC